jgi:phosphonate transport system substrate-binding protein
MMVYMATSLRNDNRHPMNSYRHMHISRFKTVCALSITLAAFGSVNLAEAGWREDVGTLTIGIVQRPDRDFEPETLAGAEAALSARLDLPVRIVSFPGYAGLIDAQVSGGVKYAIHTARSFAATLALCGCVDPVSSPVADDGTAGLMAQLVTTDPAVTSADDIAKLRLAWVSGAESLPQILATAGNPAIERQLAAASTSRYETMTEAIAAVNSGEGNAIVLWVPTDADGKPMTSQADEGLTIPASVLWSSSAVRFGPHAIRNDEPVELRLALQGLAAASTDSNGSLALDRFRGVFNLHGMSGHIPATRMNYEPLIERAMSMRLSGNVFDAEKP